MCHFAAVHGWRGHTMGFFGSTKPMCNLKIAWDGIQFVCGFVT